MRGNEDSHSVADAHRIAARMESIADCGFSDVCKLKKGESYSSAAMMTFARACPSST